ncbi:MAG: hypothetical protein IKP38_10760 [Clostridia bacterium]|nr:hypothetical protein [Clostridia bacterium]
MESIAVTKPNITVARQDVLSPFGLLTELFLQEIAGRSSRSPGFYRPVSLAFLEESEREALPSPPEIHVDFNIDLFLNRLRKETQEREKNEKKPQTPRERIIERVIVRERELRTAYAETRRVVIETGGKRYTATAPVKASEPIPAQARSGVGADRETLHIKEVGDPGSADLSRRAASPSKLLSAAGTAKPVRARISAESKLADRTLPIASRMMGAPAAGGWTPKQRELHPGYPVRSETKQTGDVSVGSILLPDVLRRRREEAIAQSENRRTVVDVPEDYGAFEDALAWGTEGTEQISETERVLREVHRAVDETLRRNALREEQAFGKPDRREEREKTATRKESAESQSGGSNFHTRARAHAYEAQKTEPAPAQGSKMPVSASETARKAEPTAAAENAEIRSEAPDRKTAAASEPAFRQPAVRTETAARETIAPIAAVPTGTESELFAELTYREEPEQPEDASAKQKDLKQPVPQTAVGIETTKPAQPETTTHAAIPSVTAQTDIPAELTYREDSEKPKVRTAAQTDRKEPVQQAISNIKEPASQSAVGTETAKAAQAETATREAIPSVDPETDIPAELTYKEDSEKPKVRTAAQTDRKEPVQKVISNIKEPASQSAVGTETAKAAQAETAKREAIPSVNSETDIPAELTYREEPEQQEYQTAEQRDAKTIAPQSAVGTETANEVQPSVETAADTAIPSADSEADIPAELTYRADSGENVRHGTEGTTVPGSEPTEQTADVRTQAAAQPEAATREAIPSVDPETDIPAELAYRQEAKQEEYQTAEQRDAKTIAPQSAVGTEPAEAAQAETATREAIPSVDPETDIPAELTYRQEPEQQALQTSEQRDAKTIAPQSVIGAEPAEAAEDAYAETTIPAAVPSIDPETGIPAELTYREEPERNAEHSALRQTVRTTQSKPSAQQSGETMRAEKAARQTVRDIRLTSEQRRRQPDAVRSGRQTAEQAAQDAQKPQDADRIALPIEDAVNTPKQPELFFATPTVGGQPPEDPTAAASEKVSQSDKASALPTWAKELLEKSGVSSAEQQSAAFNWNSGSSRSKQVNWTAPTAMPQQSDPNGRTELSFKEPREAGQGPARQQIDDAEIQRTADKVYKIIEERLRRELRRSGR